MQTTAYYRTHFQETWRSSRWFRAMFILALVWAVLRLVLQGIMVFYPISGSQAGADLRYSYLEAAEQFVRQQDMYHEPIEIVEGHYLYSPAFAMLMVPFTWLPLELAIFIHLALNVAAYVLLFITWARIFQEFSLDKAARMLVWTIPIWCVFSALWDNLTYLNMYILLALLGSLFVEAVLTERLVPASLWLTLILISKPHWAFALALPLLLGRYRFFFKLLLGGLAGYLLFAGLVVLASSPVYAWEQYLGQVEFLGRLSQDYPWRGPESGFLGYNHSLAQVIYLLAGISSASANLATGMKLLLLLPLAIIAAGNVLRPARKPGHEIPGTALELAFLLYLGVFIWLDMVWELWLALPLFVYLRAYLASKLERILLLGTFIPYALLDVYRLFIYLAGSPLIDEAYVAWDFSVYFPLFLTLLFVCYGILIKRAWPSLRSKGTTP